MASLPNPIQVSGKHNAIYEAYYKQIDPKGTGTIEAMTAAKFLKKSGLSDVILSRIWDLSDPNGKGFLDKPGFFVSLKLVSLSQNGLHINMSNIYTETPNPPKVGELPKIMPQRIQSVPVTNSDWSMKIVDRLKYEQLFESLNPVNGFLAGNKVKGVLMDSKLPMETLGKIWDLADQDKDGNLDKHEFIVAMHLVYQALDKRAVPEVLPPELQMRKPGGPPPVPAQPVIAAAPPPVAQIPRAPSGEAFGDGGFVANFPTDIAPPPVPPLPIAVPPMQRVPPPIIPMQPLISTDPLIPIGAPAPAAIDWVVVPSELKRYEGIFRDSDRDKDGLVSGLEVKNVFLQSGVPQNCLAHIWALCDTNQSGKLTLEQFALAMWMVERKQKGIEPPQVLTANMVPPSMRGIVQGVDVTPQEPKPTYSNPELEMISKEIEELAKERRALETEIAQKEADIRIKSGEVRSLQSELDTLTATLKQLENQRGEAQKRLDDLKAQESEYQQAIASVNLDLSEVSNQVSKVREQCQKQEETINEQETELNSKRSELQKLKDEEASLEKEYEENRKELDNLSKNLQDTQLQISQVRSMVTQLMETQRQMTDALIMCKAAIEANEVELVTEYQLKIEGDFQDAKNTLEKKIPESKADDPFQEQTNGFGKTEVFASNGFAGDPFAGNANGTRPMGGFDDNSFAAGGFDDAFGGSGFGGAQRDPFGASGAADPFGDKKATAVTPEPGKDDFGSDPFAALHAPTGVGQVLSPNTQRSGPPPRPESPSPALPPKKAKQPPPRPAPPRPLQGPARPSQPSGDAFANFADFDNKQPSIPPPQPPPPITVTSSTTSSTSLFQTPPPPQQQQQQQRSTTPLQLLSAKPVAAAPTDFTDDPFKDYRYEDPFSIKDPFADEEFIEQNSSEDEARSKTKLTATASPLSQAFITKTNTTKASSSEFLDNFDAFNANPSPVPSSSLSGANKSSARNTPISNFDNFANFDAFAAVPSEKTTTVTTTVTTAGAADFFDAFDDTFKDFGNNNNSTKAASTADAFDAFSDKTKAFNTLTDNAFSSADTTTSKVTKTSDIKVFDDMFNDNGFEDDFFKLKLNDNNNVVTAAALTADFSKTTNNAPSNGNFAKFDAFGDLSDSGSADFATALNNSKNLNVSQSKVQNKITLGKTNNITEAGSGAKITEKFAGDYSNPDSFDADLEEALKRSMAEK